MYTVSNRHSKWYFVMSTSGKVLFETMLEFGIFVGTILLQSVLLPVLC